MTKGSDSAFSSSELIQFNSGLALAKMGSLTKREYFAGLALGGLLSRKSDSDTIRLAVLAAIECADQLIAELNKTDGI